MYLHFVTQRPGLITCRASLLAGHVSKIGGVDLIVHRASGRSKFVFSACDPDTLPPDELSLKIDHTPEADATSIMGGSESKEDSALSTGQISTANSHASTPLVSPPSESVAPTELSWTSLEIRVIGLEDDARSGDVRRLRGCLKPADAGRGEDSGEVAEPCVAEEEGKVEDTDTEIPALSILQDTASAVQKKRKTKKGGKSKKELAPGDDAELCRRTAISWGTVHARALLRMVGGSSCVPEHSGNEWVLGLSDQIAAFDTACDTPSACDPSSYADFDSDGEEELVHTGLVPFACTNFSRSGFSPKHSGKAVGSPKMQAKRQQGSPRSVKASMPSPRTATLPDIDLVPLALGDSAIARVPGQRRRTISGASLLIGTVDEVEQRTQELLHVRYRTLSDKERAIFKVERPYETRQYSHKKIPDKTGNPLFKPLSDRQRADVYCRDGVNTKDDAQIRINNREVRILDAINASRARIGCQCRNLQAAEVKKWTVKRLHLELSSRGLDSSGARHEMVDRIVRFSESVPTCKHNPLQRHSEGSRDVIPGEDGPFVLLPAGAVERAAALQRDVLSDNILFFGSALTVHAQEPSMVSSTIGENICPCAVAGIGCIDDCRCLKYGCNNRSSDDNTAYAYDSESVREIIAEVLARHRRTSTILFTYSEMQAMRESVLAALDEKKRALRMQAAEETARSDSLFTEEISAHEADIGFSAEDTGTQVAPVDMSSSTEASHESAHGNLDAACAVVEYSNGTHDVATRASDAASELAVTDDINDVETKPSPDVCQPQSGKPGMSAASMDFAAAMAAALAAALAASDTKTAATAAAEPSTASVQPELPLKHPLPYTRGRGRGRGHGPPSLRNAQGNSPLDVAGSASHSNAHHAFTSPSTAGAIHADVVNALETSLVNPHVAAPLLGVYKLHSRGNFKRGGPLRPHFAPTVCHETSATGASVRDEVSVTQSASVGRTPANGSGCDRSDFGSRLAEPFGTVSAAPEHSDRGRRRGAARRGMVVPVPGTSTPHEQLADR
jgi:hypothetical protein